MSIPALLYNKLRQTLLDCGSFDSDRQLRTLFTHEWLKPFYNDLPEADSRANRVEATVAYLENRRRSDSGENALVLLLRLLSERLDPGDDCRWRLVELAGELERTFQEKNHAIIAPASPAVPISLTSPFQQIKIKNLKERQVALLTDYEAANRQLDRELNEVNRSRLKRQVEALEQEIRQVEAELGSLLGSGDPLSEPPRLTPEASPAGPAMVYVAVDEKLLACSRAVGLVSVPQVSAGVAGRAITGTGWLITPDLALTCWHVLEIRTYYEPPISPADLQQQVANTLLVFDHTRPGEGLEYGVKTLEYYQPQLDYALLRLQDRSDFPLRRRGYLVPETGSPFTTQTQLFVLQHPQGQPLQRSAGFYVKVTPPHLFYTTPTHAGASGAPVLKVPAWRVVALHTGEQPAERLRQGTLLKAILDDLARQRPDLYQEIMAPGNDYTNLSDFQ